MLIQDIIKNRRNELDLTMKQVADSVGVSEGTVSRWESGDISNMKRDKIYKLSKVLQISPLVILGWDEANYIPNIIPMPEMHKIPLLGVIACGAPILADEHIEDYVDIPKHVAADFALTCKGDSMINARIFDGDVVYIRKQETVENGEIAAVLIDGEATLKRVRIYNDRIILEPSNPLFDPMVFRGEEMNNVHILGKAIAFTSVVR
jgi:repressor LexA